MLDPVKVVPSKQRPDLLTLTLALRQALRTMADQVRKRERLKKQLLKLWRHQHIQVGVVLC